ncbi:uncharacterized protein LOC118196271 [Stegodyphus dumicola]|uniref:uncharacterized protein LOC118196271 n=1 Tax=Stegodyphus dumicola TaxID=202533 RepID=UPI0015AC5D5B|nr:uncharacterized protein LOC118196271 [Stegodyphus dumicola]
MTIPRLELLACVLGVRLAKYVVEALSLDEIEKHYWSDSTTALSWIKRNDQWGTFIALALRRFIARRGRPTIIYSDNGTNFIGVSSALNQIEWQKIAALETLNPINWKFIPPTAAWWGGWWERLIRIVKNILVRVLGKSSVTYEELLTVLCDAEATVNNRPLTYISNDADELRPLTPSNFLQDVKEFGTADLDHLDRNKLVKRERYCQELHEQFRRRFRKEYLGQLVQNAGTSDKIFKVGEVVLVGSENQKRLNWSTLQ